MIGSNVEYNVCRFVFEQLRVLFGNLIGFFWAIFVANQRRKAAAKATARASADKSE